MRLCTEKVVSAVPPHRPPLSPGTDFPPCPRSLPLQAITAFAADIVPVRNDACRHTLHWAACCSNPLLLLFRNVAALSAPSALQPLQTGSWCLQAAAARRCGRGCCTHCCAARVCVCTVRCCAGAQTPCQLHHQDMHIISTGNSLQPACSATLVIMPLLQQSHVLLLPRQLQLAATAAHTRHTAQQHHTAQSHKAMGQPARCCSTEHHLVQGYCSSAAQRAHCTAHPLLRSVHNMNWHSTPIPLVKAINRAAPSPLSPTSNKDTPTPHTPTHHDSNSIETSTLAVQAARAALTTATTSRCLASMLSSKQQMKDRQHNMSAHLRPGPAAPGAGA